MTATTTMMMGIFVEMDAWDRIWNRLAKMMVKMATFTKLQTMLEFLLSKVVPVPSPMFLVNGNATNNKRGFKITI